MSIVRQKPISKSTGQSKSEPPLRRLPMEILQHATKAFRADDLAVVIGGLRKSSRFGPEDVRSDEHGEVSGAFR